MEIVDQFARNLDRLATSKIEYYDVLDRPYNHTATLRQYREAMNGGALHIEEQRKEIERLRQRNSDLEALFEPFLKHFMNLPDPPMPKAPVVKHEWSPSGWWCTACRIEVPEKEVGENVDQDKYHMCFDCCQPLVRNPRVI